VWRLHVTRRGGSPLHVKIGLAALSAAGAGFAAVKAVALSMPEAGDAEVTMELQKHARRMGIDELVIAETTDDDDSQASQAALTALILDTEQALRLNRGPDGELVHRDTYVCECDMCKRTLSEVEARIARNIVNERWTDKCGRPTQDTQAAISNAVTVALRSAGHMVTYTKWHLAHHMHNDVHYARKRLREEQCGVTASRETAIRRSAASRRLGASGDRAENRARDRALLEDYNAAIMLAGVMRNEEERRAREQEREQEWRAREAMMPLWDAGKDLLGKTFWERREQERRRTLAGREQERRAREQERELRGRAASSAIDQVSHSATTTPLLLLLLP